MKNEEIKIKHKMFNHMISNGKKEIREIEILKFLKFLQKKSRKNNVDLIKLSVVNSAYTIQLRQVRKKSRKVPKEFPFVLKRESRIASGVKFMTKALNKKSRANFLLYAEKKTELFKAKEIAQKQALGKKKYIFFRWFS
jgi:ribosomal protein S7